MKRRAFMLLPLVVAARGAPSAVDYPSVRGGVPIAFPRDHGSHPQFRTEWWYVTGVAGGRQPSFGVQVTFFRSRPGVAESERSAFAPRELLFAHVALAFPHHARLMADQRAARAGFGLAQASTESTAVSIGDWSLALRDDVYAARIAARDFTLALDFRAVQRPLLQGEAGVSRKGPLPEQASYYYSVPQLSMRGTVRVDGRDEKVEGVAWLDHEWSTAYLAPEARGWDWTGINFEDGAALMAFRIRDRADNSFWAGGAFRDAKLNVSTFGRDDVRFEPLRRWRSTRTNIEYPVAFRVVAGKIDVILEPLFDDQEQDARATVGAVYWEGAVRAFRGDAAIGRGYLELTGYGEPLRL